MANIDCNKLITGVQETQLNDVDKVTWTPAILISALNQALLMLVMLRPDATATVITHTCKKGTRQALPDNGLRLLNIVANVDSNGNYGRALTLVNIHDLTVINPNWHGAAPKSILKEYVFDERMPKQFFVYPPALEGTRIEIEYSATPPTIQTINDQVPIDPVYQQPLQEFMLYKLLSGEGGQGQGMQHYNNALTMLGAKPAVDKSSKNITDGHTATGVN